MFCRLLQFTSIIFQPRRFGGSNLSTYQLSAELAIYKEELDDTLTCDGREEGFNHKTKVYEGAENVVISIQVRIDLVCSVIIMENAIKKYFLSLINPYNQNQSNWVLKI